MFGTGSTCAKLYFKVTSSGATVVRLGLFSFFHFHSGWVGVYELAEFCESTGGEEQWCGVEIGKCRQVKVAGERIFMDLWSVFKRIRDVWIGC